MYEQDEGNCNHSATCVEYLHRYMGKKETTTTPLTIVEQYLVLQFQQVQQVISRLGLPIMWGDARQMLPIYRGNFIPFEYQARGLPHVHLPFARTRIETLFPLYLSPVPSNFLFLDDVQSGYESQ